MHLLMACVDDGRGKDGSAKTGGGGGRGEGSGEKAKCVKQQHEEAKWEVESGDGRSEEKANRVANIGWRI